MSGVVGEKAVMLGKTGEIRVLFWYRIRVLVVVSFS